MALEIRQNPFGYTHENVAFREIAKNLGLLFEDQEWNGLLLGNPYCQENPSLQLDLLLYGPEFCIILDLKDYEGVVNLPNEDLFESATWKIKDKDIVIRGGSFINPFVQLKNQRNQALDIIKKEVERSPTTFKDVNYYHLQSAVLFQNSITLDSSVPGGYNRNFFVTDINNLPEKLIDIKSKFIYRLDWVSLLKEKFKANPYDIDVQLPGVESEVPTKDLKKWNTEEQVFQHVYDFIADKEQSIHIVQGPINSGKLSLAHSLRESLLSEAKVSKVEILTLSQRVAAFLNKQHPALAIKSLYSTIYGGEPEIIEKEINDDLTEELEVIPIRSKPENLNDDSLYIILEANLLSNSYQEFPMSRFGSGHLIDDLFEFLSLSDSGCKLLLIGDPYQISYGSWEEAALNIDYLKIKINAGIKIDNIQPVIDHLENDHCTRQLLRIPPKIDQDFYNELHLKNSETLKVIEDNRKIPSVLKDWENENKEFVLLTYKNKEVDRLNHWYKKRILGKEDDLNPGDRLLLYKGCTVPAENPYETPQVLSNGSFVTIEEVGEVKTFTTKPRGHDKVELNYQRLIVKPEHNQDTVEVYMLENFRKSPKAELSKEEVIAIKILLNRKMDKRLEKTPFQESELYYSYLEDVKTQSLKKSIQKFEKKKILDDDDQREMESLEEQLEAHKKSFQKKYKWTLKKQVIDQDPYINAIYAKHGWALTVHKSLGGRWDALLLNANRGENQGIDNKDYFKWLYSGLSRSMNKAVVVNFESISPLKECEFSTKVPQEIHSENANQTNLDGILQDEYFKASEKFIEQYFSEGKFSELIIRYSHYLVEEFNTKGWKLEKINTNSNFLIKIDFSKDDKSLIVIFNYDKNQNVKKHARIENIKNGKIEEVLDGISIVPEISVKGVNEDELPDDFREVIYKNWIEKLKNNDLQILNIKEFSYQDRIKIVEGKDWLTINVVYNSRGFITKIEPFRATKTELWSTVSSLIQDFEL